MSLITCPSVYEYHECLVMTFEEDKRFLCIWLLYYVSNVARFFRFAGGGAKISIKSYFTRSVFFLSVYTAAVKCSEN